MSTVSTAAAMIAYDAHGESKEDLKLRLKRVLRAVPGTVKVQIGILAAAHAKATGLHTDNELQTFDAFLRLHFPEEMSTGSEIKPATLVGKINELGAKLIGKQRYAGSVSSSPSPSANFSTSSPLFRAFAWDMNAQCMIILDMAGDF